MHTIKLAFYFRCFGLIERSAFAELIGRFQELACAMKDGRDVDTRSFSNTHGNVGRLNQVQHQLRVFPSPCT